MALVNQIQPGDFISHFGTLSRVNSKTAVADGNIELRVQEDGREVVRVEHGKTNLAVAGE